MSELTRKPRIGMAPARLKDSDPSSPFVVRPGYVAAIEQAGGLPHTIAATGPDDADAYLDAIDGLLLPGGGDLHPRWFGEEPLPGYQAMDDGIAALHLALAKGAHDRGLPTLGVCLGCQVMNVARGGSVRQHLGRDRPGAVSHRAKGERDCRHPVAIAPGSMLHRIVGVSQAEVNSRHHQAVGSLGVGLKATAVAPDAVIEAIEDGEHPFYVGVQWHPEIELDEQPNRRLFVAFVRASASFGAVRPPATAADAEEPVG